MVYSADSRYGTGNLIRHSRTCVKKDTRDLGQMLLQTNAAGELGPRFPKFNAEFFRELVVIAIVKHGLPFQFIEYDSIRNIFLYLNPETKLFSRNTAKTDVLKVYEIEKKRLIDMLRSIPGKISLPSDCWMSITTNGYISLIAHFVDNKWNLQKRILNFSFMPPPHTGVAMAEKIYSLLKDWGIEKKIESITLDNAAANDVFVSCLKNNLDLLCDGEYFHVRCCADILNSVIQEGLKEVNAAVIKVRESVKYCKGSQARECRFLDCVEYVSLSSSRGLRQDVPTRWNSTFIMFESALYFKKAFMHLEISDTNYVQCPTSEEWSKIEKISKFLKVFYEVTCAFSGTKYPTANIYFQHVLKVRLLLKEEMESDDAFLKRMAIRMWGKLEKYWAEFSTIMAIAAILDPRYKFQLVD
ncbi:Zinc finger BED domain-containing protein RICESLEEPER 2 [Bienertia sinuspersici]